MRLTLIAALGRNRGIGKDGQLLWRIPDDLKRFRSLTMGHPVIMGRKTWESIPSQFRPLPGRTNFVLTRQNPYEAPGAIVAPLFASAYVRASREPGGEEAFAIGGAQTYREAIEFADRLCLTLIDAEKESDTFFPLYELDFRKVISEEAREWNGLPYRFLELARK